jgi:oligopeptide transport system substrate-binding protein
MSFSRRAALIGGASLTLLAACGRAGAPETTLRVGLGGAPDSLDPLRAEYAVSALLFRQIFLPLVSYGPGNSEKPGVAMAWRTENNSTRWVLSLAPNLVWSDGKPITTDDVLATFARAADPKTAYPDVSEFFAIQGMEAVAKGEAEADAISVRVTAPNELTFDLTAADARFPSVLREFYPLPKHALEAHGEAWTDPANFVGSGPYVVKSRTQLRLELAANPRFVSSVPIIPTISVEAIDEAATRARMFKATDLDLVQDPPLNQLTQLRESFGARLKSFDAPRLIYISFNTRRGPLANPALRRALAAIVDRRVIANSVFQNAVTPAFQLQRGEPRFGPQGETLNEASKTALAALGITPTTPLTLELAVARDDRERAALLVADMWKPYGVIATIFGTEATGVITKLNAGDFDVGITRLDKGLKEDPLDLLASFATGGTAQSPGWKSAAFDQKLSDARGQADLARRTAMIDEAEALLMQEAPIAPLWFAPSIWLASERVSGIDPSQQPIFWGQLGLTKSPQS